MRMGGQFDTEQLDMDTMRLFALNGVYRYRNEG